MVRSRIINLAAAVGEKQQGGKIINELDNKTETVKKVIGQIPKSEKNFDGLFTVGGFWQCRRIVP